MRRAPFFLELFATADPFNRNGREIGAGMEEGEGFRIKIGLSTGGILGIFADRTVLIDRIINIVGFRLGTNDDIIFHYRSGGIDGKAGVIVL